jgi:hypothetical protein
MSGARASEYTCHMPQPSVPMVDPATGVMSTAWWNWALKIFSRTGAQVGIGTGDVQNVANGAGGTAAAAQATAATAIANAAAAQGAANAASAAVAAEAGTRAAQDALRLPLTGGTLTGALAAPELLTSVYTVATLPPGVAGARAFVSDAAAPAFGGAAVGGGVVGVPVYFDGATWMVG